MYRHNYHNYGYFSLSVYYFVFTNKTLVRGVWVKFSKLSDWPVKFSSELSVYLAGLIACENWQNDFVGAVPSFPFATPCQSSSCPAGRVDFSIMIGNILSHSRVRKGNVVYHNGVHRRAACCTFDIHIPASLVDVCVYVHSWVCPKHFPLKLSPARHLAGVVDKFHALSSQRAAARVSGTGAVVSPRGWFFSYLFITR